MEIQSANDRVDNEQNVTQRDNAVFTINRYTLNYIVIAIIFFTLGSFTGVIGQSSVTSNNQELIENAVNAAYSRQEETLNQIIESGTLSEDTAPRANNFVDDDPFIGPEDAQVVIVEFSDFNCSFCRRFHDTTFRPLLERYEGQIQFVYRDFAILGETSYTSAIASECADDQGRFWDYHDLLFANQGNFSRDNLIEYAEQLELNIPQFTSCIDEQTHLNEVRADSIAAQEIGARGTPAFLINDRFVSGAQPLEVFIQIIDAELATFTESE